MGKHHRFVLFPLAFPVQLYPVYRDFKTERCPNPFKVFQLAKFGNQVIKKWTVNPCIQYTDSEKPGLIINLFINFPFRRNSSFS